MKFARLGDIAIILKGRKPILSEAPSSDSVRVLQIDDLRNDNNLKFTDDKSGVLATKNDILIAWDGANAGTVGFGKAGYIGSTIALLGIIDTSKFNTAFVGKFLQSQFNYLRRKTTGSTIPHIDRRSLEDLKIPILDLQDQIRIANILSNAGSLISQRKESLRLLDEFLKSSFLEMFGDPVRNEKKLKQMSLGELGVWKSGGTPSRSNASLFQGNIPWITSGELNQMYIDDGKEKITPEAIEKSNASKIQEGSLLLGMYDTAALKSSINKAIVTCNQAIAFSKLDSKLCDTLFVYFNIQIGRDYFRSQQRGVRQKNMNLSMIKGLKILCPPLKSQTKFAHVVEKTEALKTRYQNSLQELENLHDSLSHKAFKGELIHIEEAKVVPFPPLLEREQNYFSKRKVLASYIINQSLNDAKFGDTKFEKLLFLSDYHVIKRGLGQNYYQKVAGPYDNTFTKPFYLQIEKGKWFKRKRSASQSVFSKGANHYKSTNTYNYFSENELKQIDKLINYFKNSDYEKPEIIATLYAVWNNRIIEKNPITDDLLIEAFLKWDAKKIKYVNRLPAALEWMRKVNLIPNGWGKVISPPSQKRRN